MSWKVSLDPKAQKDISWYKKKDKQKFDKCLKLLEEIKIDPRQGTGHPEQLKYCMDQEIWSRRISKKDRIVYIIYEEQKEVDVVSCKGHYD